ncbi:MAG: carbohydrate ABC transporter permease [Polyangiaceae bacterium]|nr:carbohydrate ABC transporter permease [Polyangiaceae bacterium]MCW5791398.1 carbohydrate ABC transporter permease [Polyangiaceae bacterium]
MRRGAVNLGLLAVGLVWLLPYAWMVVTSFKTLPEIVEAPTAPLPSGLPLDAYQEVMRSLPLGRYLFNTLVMSLLIAALQIAVALPAAYALSKLSFRGRGVAFGLVVATLLIPAQVRFVPVFAMLADVGLANTMTALVLPFGVSAFGTFLLRQALGSVPTQVIEAARMDGASELYIVFGMLPRMIVPSLVAFFMFSFIYHYSDYFWPLVMTADDKVRTLPLGVALLREQGTGVRWHVVMAGNVLLSLPVLGLFAVAQRHLLRAVTSRGL